METFDTLVTLTCAAHSVAAAVAEETPLWLTILRALGFGLVFIAAGLAALVLGTIDRIAKETGLSYSEVCECYKETRQEAGDKR